MIEQLVIDDNRVTIGIGTYSSGALLVRPHHANNKIIIGKYCSLAQNVTIFAGGNHPLNFVTTHPLKLYYGVDDFSSWSNDCGDDSEVTTIGNDVWIAHGATILSGVNIGHGAVIGAKAVVASDVPPYAIVAGNPAKVIKYRFTEDQIAKLLEIAWWDWPEEMIKENISSLCSDSIDFFFENKGMRMVSYAQNCEDVMLWRALKHIKNGFYIDVGANDPSDDSVTKWFYDNGWSGINIEPEDKYFQLLLQDRERDNNLKMALSDQKGALELYVLETRGWSTLDKNVAEEHLKNGCNYRTEVIDIETLDDVFKKYVNNEVHFLKIDVEGGEKKVLEGYSFDFFRPWIVIVEATKPNSNIDVSKEWEDILLTHQYTYGYFDGINKYYVADEHIDLLSFFQYPPNVLDNFVPSTQVHLQNQAIEANHKAEEANRLAIEAQDKILELESFKQKIEDSVIWKIYRMLNPIGVKTK